MRFLLYLLMIALFVAGVFIFAGWISRFFPARQLFIEAPVIFLFTYLWGEALSRLIGQRRRGVLYQDYLREGAWFIAFSFFVAGCIWTAEKYIGGAVSPVPLAVLLYFVFRNIRIIPRRKRPWSI